MGTVFRSGSVWLGTCLVWLLHDLPPFPPAPFFRRGSLFIENKKAVLPETGERHKNGSRQSAPFLKIKKAGILEASAPQKSRQA